MKTFWITLGTASSLLFTHGLFGHYARASDAVDTRVTFTVADDDLTRGPEQTVRGGTPSPSIPNFLPSENNRLFFENYNFRNTGFENLTHLVLYGNQPGFFEGWGTEAALVLRAMVLDDESVRLTDDGTYIRVTREHAGNTFSVTAFPITSNRFQLGYSYDIAWGGPQIFRNSKAQPALRVKWDTDIAYAFIGAKTGLSQIDKSDGTKELDTVYGVLGGGGIDILNELKLEMNGGYFYRGTIDKQELRVPEGDRYRVARWEAFGASAQVTYHVGIPIGTPIDFRLYRNDPIQRQQFFKPETYGPGLSYVFSAELSSLGQTLQDSDRPSSTVIQPAIAGDIEFRVKYNKFRIHALTVYRDLAYILFNVPSAPPFVDFPEGIEPQPEIFFSAGIDYFIEKWHLTPGIILGVQRPANLTSRGEAGSNAPDSVGQQTFVFRTNNQVDVLGAGDDVGLVYAAKLTAKWQISEIVAAIGEFQANYDPNLRSFAQDPNGIPVRLKQHPAYFGFNGMLQARF